MLFLGIDLSYILMNFWLLTQWHPALLLGRRSVVGAPSAKSQSVVCRCMFAHILAKWWHGDSIGKQQTEIAPKRPIKEDDGFSSDEEDDEYIELKRRFRAASAYMPTVTDKLDNRILLRMYGYYKMATVGPPIDSDRPSMFDQKGRVKFAAWKEINKLTKKEAMTLYADSLEDANVGFDPTATASTSGALGMRISRPQQEEEVVPSSPDEMEMSLWISAAKSDDDESCRRLLDINPDLITKKEPETGLTALHWAADSGSLEVARFLLEKKPEAILEVDGEGNQPLHLASLCDHLDIARLLLSYGASPSTLNNDNESSIHLASSIEMKTLLEG